MNGTKHLGLRRIQPHAEWEAYDRETGSRIGPLHPTRYEAQAYAEERQESTYEPQFVRPSQEPEHLEGLRLLARDLVTDALGARARALGPFTREELDAYLDGAASAVSEFDPNAKTHEEN